MKKIISILFISLFVTSVANAAPVVPNTLYQLFDHPDGALGTNYGLRCDACAYGGTAEERTWSTQSDFGSYLYWNEEDPSGAAIFGGLTRNSDSSQWGVVYIMDATASATGYTSTVGAGLLFGGGGQLYGFLGKQNNNGTSFIAQGDGHRLPGDHDEVGRGWLDVYDLGQFLPQPMMEEEMTMNQLLAAAAADDMRDRETRHRWVARLKKLIYACHEYERKCDITKGSNDWLVTMNPVPVPAALPLLASGLLGFSVFSRRKNAKA
ncbi:MAG: PEP-CTERM sorting domain-containing protein [Pseudomonadota bacterium]